MPGRLTALDATFLELEDADDSAHMHIGAALVFGPRGPAGPPGPDEVAGHLARRIARLPHFTERLSSPRVGRLRWPEWRSDERFDVANHVQLATLPAPGGDRELAAWLGEWWSHRLDRSRPLWEIALVDGLADDRWALVTKTHHCMVDGVGSVDAGAVLLDLTPGDADGTDEADVSPPPDDAASHGAVAGVLSGVGRLARGGVEAARHPGVLLDALRASRAAAEVIVRDEIIAAPRSPLNVPIGGHRRYLGVRADLGEVRAIKAALGGTINDVALAAVTGGLRELLARAAPYPPHRPLRAMVPVNVRAAAERLALGNKVTSLFVELPVGEPDGLRRHAEITRRTTELTSGDQALGTATVVELASLAPPALHATLARALFATRLFNVTVTNVPGPQTTLWALGAPMQEVWPFVPLAAEHAVGVAIFSYDGKLFFGLCADHDVIADLEPCAAGLRHALDELAEAAGVRRPAATTP